VTVKVALVAPVLMAALILLMLPAKAGHLRRRRVVAVLLLTGLATFVSLDVQGPAPASDRTTAGSARVERRVSEALARAEKRLREAEPRIRARVSRHLPVESDQLQQSAPEIEVLEFEATAATPSKTPVTEVQPPRLRIPDPPIPPAAAERQVVRGPAAAFTTITLLLAAGAVLKVVTRSHRARSTLGGQQPT